MNSILFYRAWAKRILCFPELITRIYTMKKLRYKGANIDPLAEIGKIETGPQLGNLTVGRFSFLGRIFISVQANVKIGNYVCINDGVVIQSGSHDTSDPEWRIIKKDITIDDYAWIAKKAIILPGVHIGRGAVVGAGAVVRHDVPDYAIVVGNPAVIIPKKRTTTLNYNPCEFLAANAAWIKG